MSSPTLREPSIHRIELLRLINKPSLSTTDHRHFFEHIERTETFILLDVLACHPDLILEERVKSTLLDRVTGMSFQEFRVFVARNPDFLRFDSVVAAFRALVDQEVQRGTQASRLARELAESLGGSSCARLTRCAYPPGRELDERTSRFELDLLLACRYVDRHTAEPEFARRPTVEPPARAEWLTVAEKARLAARVYEGAPSADEIGRLDDAGRASLNEKIRAELAARRRGWLWYMRHPSLQPVFDAELCTQLVAGLVHERLDDVIATEDLRSWIPCSEVSQQVVQRPNDSIWIERAPDWLDASLIDRARQVSDVTELRALVSRFKAAGKETERNLFLEVLVEHVKTGAVREAPRLASDLLGNSSAWKRFGRAMVFELLRKRRFFDLRGLVFGDSRHHITSLEDLEAALQPLAVAIHYAFAAALLTWAQELAHVRDHVTVARALAAIGVLDPPRHFTKELHSFREKAPLSENARQFADYIHGIARSHGGSDAVIYAVFQCIDELLAAQRPSPTSGA
jgi:hypothetical protein